MKKLFLVPSVLLLFQCGLFAQELVMLTNRPVMPGTETSNIGPSNAKVYEYNVYSKPELPKDIDPQSIGSHFLGDEIARKMYLLDKTYTYETHIAPGNPATTTVTRKPAIYNSVKKIEAYLKKSVRRKEITEEAAMQEFNKVVDVALNIFFQDTNTLEQQIKETDKAPDLLDLYIQRIHIHYR